MRLDYFGTKKYVQMECRDAGIGVMFHKVGTIAGPHTDGRTLHVFNPDHMWSDEQWEDWEYEVQHEIGHESPENTAPHWKELVKEKRIGGKTLLFNLWNLMSDHVQEHNRIGKYSGRDRILKLGRARFVNARLLSTDVMSSHSDTRIGSIFKLAAIYDTWCRENWNEYLVGNGLTAAASLDGDELDMWNRLYKSGINIHEGENEYDSYQFALDILNALGEDAEEHEKAAQEEYGRQYGKGGDADSGEGESEGEGEADSEGDAERGRGVLSDEEGKEVGKYIVHTHYAKPGEGSYSRPEAGQHVEYADSYAASGSFSPKDPKIVDIKARDFKGLRVDRSKDVTVPMIEAVNGGKMLAGQVKRLLITMKQMHWHHGYKRGCISGKNLWKAKAPIYSEEVFKKKTAALELDTAVTVLTDNSGSMCGEKFAHAARAGIMLNEAMSKIGVPIELLSFSEDHDGPVNIIVKSFMDRTNNEAELVDRYAHCACWMEQNSDGESIMWAFDRLRQRKEKRKVLIVLSDGSPAAYNGSYHAEYDHTKHVIKTIEEKSRVEIYGIGIMDHNVEKLYKEHKVLKHASELENMLLGLVKSKLLRA